MTEEINELSAKLIRLGSVEVAQELESTDSGIPNNELMQLGFLFQRFDIRSAQDLQEYLEKMGEFVKSQEKFASTMKEKIEILANARGRTIL
jgi:hypothetical protein